MTEPATTILGAEVEGAVVDVRVEDGEVRAVGPDLPRDGSVVVDAAGGALLPGLHDHHLHLLALAAARGSVDTATAGDPRAFDALVRAAHAAAPSGTWLRVIGYGEHHGPLDRHRLDRLAPGRAARVQHRSGAAWVVSSTALQLLDLAGTEVAGVERDRGGEPTGWLHRMDAVVADRLRASPPDLGAVGRQLARFGVTGVTDATPYETADAFELLAAARRSGGLPQRVVVTGGTPLAAGSPPAPLEQGPVKVVVADNDLPPIEALIASFAAARRAGRAVAVHCVSRVGLVLALAAWEAVGAAPGDRVEHGSVIPVELVARLRELGLCVVTQPAFVLDRGDRYLAEVDPDDQPHLYRCRSLLDAGVPVGGSTDAPFGPPDPWLAMVAAADRRTAGGAIVGPAETVEPDRALALFLGRPDAPGGPPRRVAAGAPADLCLLAEPLAGVLRAPSSELVRACWIGGRLAPGQVA